MAIVQIRGVDDADLGVLRERARDSDVSLSTYLRGLLHAAATNPTRREVIERIATREPVDVSREQISELISAGRPAEHQ